MFLDHSDTIDTPTFNWRCDCVPERLFTEREEKGKSGGEYRLRAAAHAIPCKRKQSSEEKEKKKLITHACTLLRGSPVEGHLPFEIVNVGVQATNRSNIEIGYQIQRDRLEFVVLQNNIKPNQRIGRRHLTTRHAIRERECESDGLQWCSLSAASDHAGPTRCALRVSPLVPESRA
jgi:hypothetical protein